ncbi:MAG TPA: hypothetical protein VIC85_02340 [Ktedonobacterales bacterium]|jgi:hypothetical protein
MRDYDSRRMAAARSRRASPDELRAARERYKELQEELRQLEVAPETKNGEDRLDRYDRDLRIQALREEFQSLAETPLPPPRNGILLALVMTVGSFLLCAFCAGGTYTGLLLLNQKPTAQTTADGFWADMLAGSYTQAHDDYFAPSLRVALASQQFGIDAQNADTLYGKVTSAVVTKVAGDQQNNATITYSVQRTAPGGKVVTYPVTLTLANHQGNWGISDIGAAVTPHAAGVPAPAPTPTPKTTSPPTATTGS